MAELVEFYLTSLWEFRQAGVERVLNDILALEIVSLQQNIHNAIDQTHC